MPVDVLKEIDKVLRLESAAIAAAADRFSKSGSESSTRLAQSVELLHQALENGGKIVVTGIGKSGKVAQKIAATLSSTGSLAVFLHPTEGLHGDLGVVTSKDAVLALSYTGNTDEVLRLLPSLRSRGVPIIAIVGNPSSSLATQANTWIDARVETEACPHGLAPTTSTTLALALGDAIAVALMKLKGFDPEAFARNHPGGSLGRKLTLKVADLMHAGDAVATIAPGASMDDVIVASTRKKLGAVLVTEGPKLLGIITDGDLRRALGHREKFFHLKASEVMTRSPVFATPDMMASDALNLMENRPSQISVLPVVDASGHWKGLIRLHDLVQSF